MKFLILILGLMLSYPTWAMELKATVNDTPISDLDVKNWARLLKMQQPDVYDFMPQKEAGYPVDTPFKDLALKGHFVARTMMAVEAIWPRRMKTALR